MRIKLYATLAFLAVLILILTGCVPDAPYKISGPTAPASLADGWDIATPEDVGISESSLNEIHSQFTREDRYFNALSLLVVKDSKLVFEAYCRDIQSRDQYGHVASVTKSVTSLICGILLSEGYLDSLSQTLYSIIPDKFPADTRKRSITIQHLLTMTSGLSFDNDDFSAEIYSDEPGDPIQYILDKPMYSTPGEEFYYRDCDPHLLSFAIDRLTGKSVEQCARDRLFGPLSINDYYWDSDHKGTTMGAHGLHLRPRDLAKIGQMVLDHGKWKESRIVDSAWVAESTRKQVDTQHRAEPDVADYGYYWWVLPRWEAVEARGHGGNFIFILPSKQMVIVMTSMPDADGEVVATRPEQFHELINPLIGD